MEKTIIFNNELTMETIYQLIEKLEAISHPIEEDIPEKINLFFSTNGGEISSTRVLIDYINNYPIPILITFFDQCSSSGFDFALHVEQEKQVLDTAYSVIHLSSADIPSRDLKDSKSFVYFFNNTYCKNLDTRAIDDFKMAGIGEHDINTILNGKDVYLDNKQFLKAIETYAANKTLVALNEELEAIENEKNELLSMKNEILQKINKKKNKIKKINKKRSV